MNFSNANEVRRFHLAQAEMVRSTATQSSVGKLHSLKAGPVLPKAAHPTAAGTRHMGMAARWKQ